ncbi:MAG: DUF5683 domain-containing protein [Longimicrobiales bacterium]
MKRTVRSTFTIAAVIASLAALTDEAAAQVVTADTIAAADSVPPPARSGPSPRGAMIRSWLLPGWGQAAVGSYMRGGFWFAIEGTSWYMLLKTIGKLNTAKEWEGRFVRIATDSLNQLIATDSLAAERLSDPFAFDDAVNQDSGVIRIRNLVNARAQQRQDWITYTLFFTLISGVDAYVNAHLRDFPVDISAVPSTGGTMQLTVSVPLGWGRTAKPRANSSMKAYRPRRW